MTSFIPKHGGYRKLKSFQNAEIVYDFTVEFCRVYIKSFKLSEQMEGAARGGCQNISEGSQTSGTSKQSELRLVHVARASQEELLLDYQQFLRQRGLAHWGKDDLRAQEIRKLAYMSNRSYTTYKTYMKDAEAAANCAICLIKQTSYLLDQQIKALEKELLEQGDMRERFKNERGKELKKHLLKDGPPIDEFLAEFGKKRLENGQVVNMNSGET